MAGRPPPMSWRSPSSAPARLRGCTSSASTPPGETVELRLTARDRSAYAAGALAAADWLVALDRTPGTHPFDAVVDDRLAELDTTVAPVTALAVASR